LNKSQRLLVFVEESITYFEEKLKGIGPTGEYGYTPVQEPFNPKVAENHLLENYTVGFMGNVEVSGWGVVREEEDVIYA
jgi:hypothetical protein